MLDFPAPVGPTSATVFPAGTSNEIPRSTGSSGLYVKWTFSRATRPSMSSASIASSASRTSGTASATANTRSPDTIACSIMLRFSESERIGSKKRSMSR